MNSENDAETLARLRDQIELMEELTAAAAQAACAAIDTEVGDQLPVGVRLAIVSGLWDGLAAVAATAS